MKKCFVCGTPVQVVRPGKPERLPLCGMTCKQIYVAMTPQLGAVHELQEGRLPGEVDRE